MFERLKQLYLEGKIGKTALEIAVVKGFITKEQKGEIIDEGEKKVDK